jgi:hypothetical protein
VFGSTEYTTWSVKLGNLIDARKLAAEYAGTRKATCGSRYAQGLQLLCRENPPLVPPDTHALAGVWRKDAAFTEGGLSNFHGASRDRAFALGWTAVYVQLLHTVYQDANVKEMGLSVWSAWDKVGWGTYGQDTDALQDGRDAAAICKANPLLRGWKANGETWAEGEGKWKTDAFLKGWNEGGAPVPLGWSVNSSDTASSPRQYAYDVALSSPGSDIDPQVYGADHPQLTVNACLGNLALIPVPVDRTTMSFSVTGSGTGPFTDYRTWPGPRRLWRPDRATVATWEALRR